MALKEIHERDNHGIRVTLYWDDESNTMTVNVQDRKDPAVALVLVGVPTCDWQTAFEHPFSYVPPLKGVANDDYRCY